MMTYNVDVCDSLTNGTLGEVVGFKYDQNDQLKYILVKFDEAECGRERRNQFGNDDYIKQLITPVDIFEFNFPYSRSKHVTSSSVQATCLQFPLKLAYAATAHKIQGLTVKKPSCLVLNLNDWLKPAMAYVMLSRIQCLSQLFILNSIPKDKIEAHGSALEELARLDSVCINNKQEEKAELTIACLNTSSLKKHFDDIKCDKDLITADVICLQETWLAPDSDHGNKFDLENLQCHLNSYGIGKGIATYYNNDFSLERDIASSTYQVTKVSSSEYIIINVYRSKSANKDFISVLNELFEFDKTMVLCGDFNYCFQEEGSHPILKFLNDKKFKQIVNGSTHIEGRCLDHVYIYDSLISSTKTFFSEVSCCYYSDHDRTITCVKSSQFSNR